MSETKTSDYDLMLQSAWLYYIHGYGQEEVAKRLLISRFKVNRLLAQARDAGLVKISIEHEMIETLALADWLASHFGLTECIITPSLTGIEEQQDVATADLMARRAVGIAGANYLTRRLQTAAPITIGVGWGRTVIELANAFAAVPKPNADFVSLTGSPVNGNLGSFTAVQRLAAACGGSAHFLMAPLLVDSEADLGVFMRQSGIESTMARARSAAFYLLSFSACTAESPLFQEAGLSKRDIREVEKSGAVAELAGKFFDPTGAEAEVDIGRRTPSPDLDDLRRTELVLLAAGSAKAAALEALLKTGLVDRLIIDGSLAARLVERTGRAKAPGSAVTFGDITSAGETR